MESGKDNGPTHAPAEGEAPFIHCCSLVTGIAESFVVLLNNSIFQVWHRSSHEPPDVFIDVFSVVFFLDKGSI